ncbi:MAG: SLAP domain-containing protein [Lachnospiraceae bacterium]|nr:SLAP domain-containing protein [Lachnospiraceae bacterium]
MAGLNRDICKLYKSVLCLLLAVCMLLSMPLGAEASRRTKYGTFRGNEPDTYSISGDTVYFYPKKIFYSGSKIECHVYVVNKTGAKIAGLSDVTLTLRDKNGKTVAKHTFKEKRAIKISNNKLKSVKYIFPKSAVKKKQFYFKDAEKMSIRAKYIYYLP